jgi:RNA polymerase sigma-70 factor (ECF subfamily)
MDEQAAASLRRHYGTVYRYIRRRAGSREEAEDVTQEVFEVAIAALGQARLDADATPLAWLYTVARHRLIDRVRARRTLSAHDLQAVPAVGGERTYGAGLVQALVQGLQHLSEPQRRVVVLKLFEGRSFAEIAVEVGASEEACRMRFSRGLASLRRQLQEKGVEP